MDCRSFPSIAQTRRTNWFDLKTKIKSTTTTKHSIKIKRNKTKKPKYICLMYQRSIENILHFPCLHFQFILLCIIRWCIAMPCRQLIFPSWIICSCQKGIVKLNGVRIVTAFPTWSWKWVNNVIKLVFMTNYLTLWAMTTLHDYEALVYPTLDRDLCFSWSKKSPVLTLN